MDMDSDKLFKKTGGFTHNPVRLLEQVRQKIVHLRNCEVILDVDVARLYGVETKRVNEAVRNNPDKFPEGYMFKLTREETTCLRSKNSTANKRPLPASNKTYSFPETYPDYFLPLHSPALFPHHTVLQCQRPISLGYFLSTQFYASPAPTG